MHEGSFKKERIWQWYQLNEFRTLHTSGGFSLPCMYQNESDLQLIPIESLSKMSTWYTKVKQMYEHIAYELRYEYLNSIEHDSICIKAHYLI